MQREKVDEFQLRMIAVDMDGTLLGEDGQVSPRNLAAMQAAERAGVEVVVATGRRHCYAMRVLRGLGLRPEDAVVSSNGTVIRTMGSGNDGSHLLERTLMQRSTALWLCSHVEEFRNSLVVTFDMAGPDGEDPRGALVVEHMDELHGSIGKWMAANEPYIAHIAPIEQALEGDEPIQMMLCGTVERMRRAEARLLEHPGVLAAGVTPVDIAAHAEVTLHRTEYPLRDLSIVDILPAGCSKGSALRRLGARRDVKMEELLAIGDNWNDVSMLEEAGRAVLMGNAPDDLKATAAARGWTIGARHSEDGVAEAIEAALSVAR